MPMNLKQLAESLGVSQTTVSRALNGYPEVSEKTRARIVAAAKAHNYSPSTRAKSLATGRAMAIGHVIPISNNSEIVNPIFADFIAGAGEYGLDFNPDYNGGDQEGVGWYQRTIKDGRRWSAYQ